MILTTVAVALGAAVVALSATTAVMYESRRKIKREREIIVARLRQVEMVRELDLQALRALQRANEANRFARRVSDCDALAQAERNLGIAEDALTGSIGLSREIASWGAR